MAESVPDPIRHAVIFAHPGEDSFTAAVVTAYAEAVEANGQEVVVRDLYRMGFDPVLKESERPGTADFRLSADVRAELDQLRGAQIFTFVYPIWFGLPPAMMKGYIDRVIGSGVTARAITAKQGEGLLNDAHLLSITLSGADEAWLDEQGQQDALRHLSGRYLFHAFAMRSAETMHIGAIASGLSPRTADMHLHAVRERARRTCAKLYAERHGMALPTGIGDGS